MKKSTKAIASIFILCGISAYVFKSRQREVKFDTVIRVKKPNQKLKIGDAVDLEVGVKNISDLGTSYMRSGSILQQFRFNVYSKTTGKQVSLSENGLSVLNYEKIVAGAQSTAMLIKKNEAIFQEVNIASYYVFMPSETYIVSAEAMDEGERIGNPSPKVEISFQ